MGAARHQRQRDCARLHGDRQHRGAARRSGSLPNHHRTHSGREVGNTSGPCGRRDLPRVARIGLRARPRARGGRRLAQSLKGEAMSTTTIAHPARASAGAFLMRLPFVGAFARLVGPAALAAAGMIGAGAVATRLLAGAWFGFDLLWCALYVVPMVVISLDSASRVGVLSGGRGMFEMIRDDIGAWLAWGIFVPTVLVNVIVNMSQMSAMVEGLYGSVGLLPPTSGQGGTGLLFVTLGLTALTLVSAVLGGYKRVEK